MAPFILRKRLFTFLFVFAGLAYHILCNKFGIHGFDFRYHLYPATIVYFGIGAALYHFAYPLIQSGGCQFSITTNKKQNIQKIVNALVTLLIFFMIFKVQNILTSWQLLFFAAIIPLLFKITSKMKVDLFLGSLSYGIYVAHLPVIQILNNYGNEVFGLNQFVSVSLISLLITILINKYIERPLNSYRERFFK
jgi:peptidoglycan/LPS O-acetylase OafA/YrhL